MFVIGIIVGFIVTIILEFVAISWIMLGDK